MARRPRPRFRGVCAICDNTNSSTQICDNCYDDPINADWVETWEYVDEYIEDRPSTAKMTLSELSDSKLRPATELQQLINDLHARGRMVEVKRIDAKGRSRGVWYRRVDYKFREIAREVGCSVTYVIRVIEGPIK